MTSSITSIQSTVKNQIIDKSVIPVIGSMPVTITSYNLKPGAIANFWFDNTLVNQFVQPASLLTVNTGYNANVFSSGEGIFCPFSGGYAVINEISQTTNLQITENFTCLNLAPFGSNTLISMAGQYNVNDIVYQSNNSANVYANTVVGKVAYWNVSTGILVVTPTVGAFNTLSSANTLFKVGNTSALANVMTIVTGNRFPRTAPVYSTSNTSKFFLANTYVPNHGVSPVSNNGNILVLSGITPNVNIVGNSIYVTHGTGLGQKANIIAWNVLTNIVTLDSTWSVGGNTFYGIGNTYVDAIGICTGIFYIPDDVNYNFQSGNRLITVNDSLVSAIDPAATMRSTATFVASGQLPTGGTASPIVPVTPQLSPAANNTVAPSSPTSIGINNNGNVTNPSTFANPLVQTFFTPHSNSSGTDYGCFATSVNLFFQNIPSGNATQFPVTVYLVTTTNGYPTSNVLGYSTRRSEEINVTDGNTTFPNSSNSSTYTNFPFVDPIYLNPGTEYGLVVYSESPSYNIWISSIGNTVANGTAIVSQSPYIGSLYMPQNASAWNPIQNQSLMFTLNKAAFNQNVTSAIFAVVPPTQNIFVDMVTLHSADLTFPAANVAYSYRSTTANNGLYDASFNVLNTDVPYYYGGDLTKSSLNSNRRRLISAGNSNSYQIQVSMQTYNPDVSPVFNYEALKLITFSNIINSGGIAPSDISILTTGTHSNAANIVVTFGAPTGDNGVQATGYVASLNGSSVTAITMINPGAGYVVAPSIFINEAGVASNATAIVNGENGQSGGNGNARYITRPITLADGFDSGDLQVFLSAIRPAGTDISVYYKVLSASDTQTIANVYWQLMSKQVDIYSPDQQTPINLVFNTGLNSLGVPNGSVQYVQNGITYPLGGKFKTFQIKIVLTANDPTVPPEVQTMQVAAVAAG